MTAYQTTYFTYINVSATESFIEQLGTTNSRGGFNEDGTTIGTTAGFYEQGTQTDSTNAPPSNTVITSSFSESFGTDYISQYLVTYPTTLSTYPTFNSTFTQKGYSIGGGSIVSYSQTITNITTATSVFNTVTADTVFVFGSLNTTGTATGTVFADSSISATVFLLSPGEIYGELTATGMGYLSSFAKFHTTNFTVFPSYTTYVLTGITFTSTSSVDYFSSSDFSTLSYNILTASTTDANTPYYPLYSTGVTTAAFNIYQYTTDTSETTLTTTCTGSTFSSFDTDFCTEVDVTIQSFLSSTYLGTTSIYTTSPGLLPRTTNFTITGDSFVIPFYTEANSTNPLYQLPGTPITSYSSSMSAFSSSYSMLTTQQTTSIGLYFFSFNGGGDNTTDFTSTSSTGGIFSEFASTHIGNSTGVTYHPLAVNGLSMSYFPPPTLYLPYNQYGFRLQASGPLYLGLSLGTFNFPSFFLSYCATNTSEFTPAIYPQPKQWTDGISSYTGVFNSYSVTLSYVSNITQTSAITYSAQWVGIGNLTDTLMYQDTGVSFTNFSIFPNQFQNPVNNAGIQGICGIGHPASLTANNAVYYAQPGAYWVGTTTIYYSTFTTFNTTGPCTLQNNSWDLVSVFNTAATAELAYISAAGSGTKSTIPNGSIPVSLASQFPQHLTGWVPPVFLVFDGTVYHNPYSISQILNYL